MKKRILVTSALPYANGAIHLGHVLEAIQTDIFVRFQRQIGNDCYYFCADDTHGTPIMLASSKAGVPPDEFIRTVREDHIIDLTAFGVRYDNYYTTNSPENQRYSNQIYLNLKDKGHISEREIEQSYCNHDRMFLPDRFIKGTCPKCDAKDQYGDSCESCGTSYSPKDLKDSKCALCGTAPILKSSKHLFFKLQDFSEQLEQWINAPGRMHEGAQKKLREWFLAGLQEWDISRDGPYFGFPIPGEENKYFYVWLDAPIGYMASSRNHFGSDSEFASYWNDPNAEIIHFIGKDILYFHALFWPAMLMGSGFETPKQIHVHGFLTVNGEKMSKSRGTFINAKDFASFLDPEHFRFYMACRLGANMDDVDLSFEDYISRVNSDLIGNLVNLLSRTGTTILDKLDRKLGKLTLAGKTLQEQILAKEMEIKESFEERNYARVMKEITHCGDLVNRYVNDNAPWALIKKDPESARAVVTDALHSAYVIFTYLSPIVPKISQKVMEFFKVDRLDYSNIRKSFENESIEPYQNLSERVNEKNINQLIEAGKPKDAESMETSKNLETKTTSNLISIDELAKVELRVGKIEDAMPVEGADKLIKCIVSLGDFGTKNVFAGIKSAYKPEELIGKSVVVVANLQPRKMKFGLSEAMLLASGSGEELSLFVPDRKAKPGDLLK